MSQTIEPRRSAGRLLVAWLPRLLGLLLLGVLLVRFDTRRMLQAISTADGSLILLATAGMIPLIAIKTVRWQAVLRAQQVRFPFLPALAAYFGSLFIGYLTPGRLGEFVKAAHVSRRDAVPFGQAFSTVLADRLFDLYALLLVGGAAVANMTTGNLLITIVGPALVLTLGLVAFLNRSTFGWLGRVASRCERGGRLAAVGRWVSDTRDGLRQLTTGWLLLAIGLTILAYLLFYGQCYLLALALSLPIDMVRVSMAVALGSLVTLIPISISGLGTREAVIVAYLGNFGVTPEAALGFSFLVFATFYIAGGLMGAVAWWLHPVPLSLGSQR
jgi:glycosyltransferase 2 family protein